VPPIELAIHTGWYVCTIDHDASLVNTNRYVLYIFITYCIYIL
jgi:hypothetical protein